MAISSARESRVSTGVETVRRLERGPLVHPASAPEEILQVAREHEVDLIVMGGTRRGLIGRMLWPELAREVVWNADVPVLIWY